MSLVASVSFHRVELMSCVRLSLELCMAPWLPYLHITAIVEICCGMKHLPPCFWQFTYFEATPRQPRPSFWWKTKFVIEKFPIFLMKEHYTPLQWPNLRNHIQATCGLPVVNFSLSL